MIKDLHRAGATFFVLLILAMSSSAEQSPPTGGTGAWFLACLVASLLGALQALILMVLLGIRKEQGKLWTRADEHGHPIEIECSGDSCKIKAHTVGITPNSNK